MDNESKSKKNEAFEEERYKNGWTLKIAKLNSKILSVSLIDQAGQGVDSKGFLLQKDDDIDVFAEYVKLFEENPEKNLRKLIKLSTPPY